MIVTVFYNSTPHAKCEDALLYLYIPLFNVKTEHVLQYQSFLFDNQIIKFHQMALLYKDDSHTLIIN